MQELTNQQKQLIFDHCLGLASKQEQDQAVKLIESNQQAQKLNSTLKSHFSILETLPAEPCPDELAESTIARLKNATRTSQLQLETLIAKEQAKTTTIRPAKWFNLARMAAAAAVIVFVFSIVFPLLRMARQNYWKQCCQAQLSKIFQGVSSYMTDHDDQLPAIATAHGQPWWKVGYKGRENHSNTRNIWLLVKNNYVHPINFVCPGKRQGRALMFDTSQVQNFNDFPSRRYITYSLRIPCSSGKNAGTLGKKVLMSDLNPLFEKLPNDYSRSLHIKLTSDLLKLNSNNHCREGQSVLFCDGSVSFTDTRYVDEVTQDDIFTLQNTQSYQGVEFPTCETDAFLAP